MQQMAEAIVEAYAKKLSGCVNVEEYREGEKSQTWMSSVDDDYPLSFLLRYLVSSEQARELDMLLFDIRWLMLLMKFRGWISLSSDFERLF